MAFNLCGPFMKKHGIDQLHSQGALKIQGRLVPLVESHKPRQHEQVTDKVYIQEDVTLPPSSETHVQVQAPAINQGRMAAGDVYVMGGATFMEKTDLHPWMNALAQAGPDGKMAVGLMNTQPYSITVKKGTHYGQATATCTVTEATAQPWKLATIQPDDRKVKTATAPPSKDELRQLIADFRLDQSPALTRTEDMVRAAGLLWRNREAFAFDGGFGATNKIKHHINTEPGKGPINQRYRPLNPTLEKDLQA